MWENEKSIENWRNNKMHRLAQEAGTKVHFKDYRIRVGERISFWLQGETSKLNNESIDDFFHKKKYTKSTLKAYCYPFQKKEFNLNNESLDSLKKLKEDSFEWLNKKHKLGFFVTDDKNYICLKNTWLVGYLNKNYPNIDHSKKLILSNFAGTRNATSAIFTVGKS